MSTRRHTPIPAAPKGLCRGCRQPVTPPRRTWCSDACVERALIRSDPGAARRAVFARDGGVCGACGFPAGKAERILHRLHRSRWREDGAGIDDALAAVALLVRVWAGRAWGRFDRPPHLWEADHIVAVVEGGGGCDLDNYRTLCLACHKAKTAAMAGRRARARRRGPQQVLPGLPGLVAGT